MEFGWTSIHESKNYFTLKEISFAVKWSPFTATVADLKVLPAEVAVSPHWISVRRGPSPWNVIQSWSTITFSLQYRHWNIQFWSEHTNHLYFAMNPKWCKNIYILINLFGHEFRRQQYILHSFFNNLITTFVDWLWHTSKKQLVANKGYIYILFIISLHSACSCV